MIQIKFIRHGERLDITYPLYWLICFGYYWADPPLTAHGHEIAQKKGQELALDGFNPRYIYTSPYIRTRETAFDLKLTYPEAEIMLEPLLAEYQPWFKNHIDLHPAGVPTTYDGKPTPFSYPEDFENFGKRVEFIYEKLLDKKQSICVVTHGEVLTYLISKFQSAFPGRLLDLKKVDYLTTLSFQYDPDTKEIDETSVKLE